MKKILQIVAIFAVLMLASLSTVVAGDLADTLSVADVEVNGNDVDTDEIISVNEGETLEVEIVLENLATEDLEDLEVEIEINGYEYNDYVNLEDETTVDVAAGTSKTVSLEIDLPKDMEAGQEYSLKISVDDRNSNGITEEVSLYIESQKHELDISDISLSSSSVEAGHSLLATVQIANYGSVSEDDVKVTVAIAELGISDVDYIDEVEVDIETDDDENEYVDGVSYETTEELYLLIPDCAEAGEYTVEVTAEYDSYESTSESYTVTVTEGDYCESSSSEDERLVIAVGPENQDVNAGSKATFAIALSNEGSESETFTLELDADSSLTQTSLTESLVVLNSGESTLIYGYVTAAEDASGYVPVTLSVANDGETLETINLSVDVAEDSSASSSLRNALEIALIVIVVLLVLVGLIVGFTRLRKEDDEEQTYY